MATPPSRDPKDVADNKDLAALGYVWVLSVVVLLARRDSPFAQFHARQGAVLFGLSLVAWAMPFVGKLAELLILALCAIGFLHAAQGEWKDLPIVGPLARGAIGDLRNSWKDVVDACASLWRRVRPKDAPADTATPQPAHSKPLPVIDAAMHDAPPVHAQGADPAPVPVPPVAEPPLHAQSADPVPNDPPLPVEPPAPSSSTDPSSMPPGA